MNNLREKIEQKKLHIMNNIQQHKEHIQSSLNHSQQKQYEKLVKIQNKMDETQKKLIHLHGKAQDKQLERLEKLRKKQDSLIFFKKEQAKFQTNLSDNSSYLDQNSQKVPIIDSISNRNLDKGIQYAIQIGEYKEERKSELIERPQNIQQQQNDLVGSSLKKPIKSSKIIHKCQKVLIKISQINLNSNPKTLQTKLNKLLRTKVKLQYLAPDVLDEQVNHQVQRTIESINELFRTKMVSNNQTYQQEMIQPEDDNFIKVETSQMLYLQNKLKDELKFQETPTQQMEDKNTSLESKESSQMECICQICFDRQRCYIAVPCGHFIYCEICKDLVKDECLLCRKQVLQLMKVFL